MNVQKLGRGEPDSYYRSGWQASLKSYPTITLNSPSNSWRIKDRLDVTCYFISLLTCSTCFGHLYIHHQELATILLNCHIGRIVLGLMCVGVSVWLGWSGIRVAGWIFSIRTLVRVSNLSCINSRNLAVQIIRFEPKNQPKTSVNLQQAWFSTLLLQAICLFLTQQPLSGPWPSHAWSFYITHNDAAQSVRFLWTSDQLVANTSTWQHPTLTTDTYPYSSCGIRNHNLSRRAALDCAATGTGLLPAAALANTHDLTNNHVPV